MEYKDTLNLPATDFPMKANLNQREPLMLAKWQEDGLYEQMEAAGADKPLYVLHDGPPYANGHIHIGHALNKILKDIVLKVKRMEGFHAPYVPGWDCHGLPIELQVEKNLGSKKSQVSKLEMRKLCREYAAKFVEIQKEEFKRLGIQGDWENPYLTMNYEYEGLTAGELAKFAHNNGLYRGRKPVHWCSSCVTALAEAEVEYADHTSPSIYVRFAVQDDLSAVIPALAGKQAYVVIWTTTPWTIPANLAVALHPEFDYVALETEKGVLIVAEGLKDSFLAAVGLTGEVIATFSATLLERKRCKHPFYDQDSIILLGEHVTLEAGTGCVHTAPGHGQEDYELALKEGLEVYNPVDNHGKYLATVEFFGGQQVFAANQSVIDKLTETGALLQTSRISHSYPHCWRCKKPIIFRATEQWFISMKANDLRGKALAAIDQVQWIPRWGRERIYGMVENRPDWCVSRQRSWGVPITAFSCTACGEYVADGKLMDHVAGIFKEHSSDVWFDWSAEQLLPEGTVCPKCGAAAFEKENDILDVWFDSGVSHAAVLEANPKLSSPADLYLEGSDQHRGWFHSSLLESVGTRGVAPYRSVLTHGFVLDGKGHKMSKSMGNVVAPEDVIKKFGADVLRLWCSAQDYRDDTRISEEILTRVSEAYRRIRNTCRYILGSISDFDPSTQSVSHADMPEIDRWALHQLESLKERVLTAYQDFAFHVIYQDVNGFCTVEMSSFYLDILKDRMYTSKADSLSRRSAQTVLHEILDTLLRLLAPVLSFTADEAWQHMPARQEKSVHLAAFPLLHPEWKDNQLVERWERIIKVRADVSKALELARAAKTIGHSLDASVSIAAPLELLGFLREYESELQSIFIVSKVSLGDSLSNECWNSENIAGLKIQIAAAPGEKCERCWCYSEELWSDPSHPTICPKCTDAVNKDNQHIDIFVKDLMLTEVVCISPEDALVDVIQSMLDCGYSCMIIVEDLFPLGIITERDIVRLMAEFFTNMPPNPILVREVMSAPVVTVTEQTTLFEALAISSSQGIRHLPVVDNAGHLMGLVTESDLAKAHYYVFEKQSMIIERSVNNRTRELQRANEHLKELSTIDVLMGIGNRRAMDVDLNHTHALALRYERTYAVLLYDVDFFKSYNDSVGHLAGDEVLRKIAKYVSSCIRKSDRLYRYGGEEILLLLPETTPQGALILAGRIIEGLADLKIPHPASPLSVVTISCGVASQTLGSAHDSWQDVVALADAALYVAKNSGRNRAIAAPVQ